MEVPDEVPDGSGTDICVGGLEDVAEGNELGFVDNGSADTGWKEGTDEETSLECSCEEETGAVPDGSCMDIGWEDCPAADEGT